MADDARERWKRLGFLGLIALILYRLGLLQGLLGIIPGVQPGPGGTKPKPEPGNGWKPEWKEQEQLRVLHNDKIVTDPTNPYGTRVEKGAPEPLDAAKKEVLVLSYSVPPGALSVPLSPAGMQPVEQDYFSKTFPGQAIPLAEVIAFRLNRRMGYFIEKRMAVGGGSTWAWAPESDALGARYVVKQGQGTDSVQFHIQGIRGNDAREIGKELGAIIEDLLRSNGLGWYDPIARGKYIRG